MTIHNNSHPIFRILQQQLYKTFILCHLKTHACFFITTTKSIFEFYKKSFILSDEASEKKQELYFNSKSRTDFISVDEAPILALNLP